MQTLIFIIFRLIAYLPLPLLHQIGKISGSLIYYLSRQTRQRIQNNLQTAGIISDQTMIKTVLQETAKGGLELTLAFFRSPQHISQLFQKVYGWEHIESALQSGQGLLLITPHLGSYDLAGRYISERLPFPLTAMYKPPKIAAFDAVMQAGRVRGKGRTAPTNLQGVKQIIKALRQGEATIVLPDHVPDPHTGDGVWVNFFNRPAYTMTLVGKLAQVQNVQTLFFCGERLPNGQGFQLHIAPFSGSLNGNKEHDAQLINHEIEKWIRRFPSQYLFAYNRYKTPAGAPPPESATKSPI